MKPITSKNFPTSNNDNDIESNLKTNNDIVNDIDSSTVDKVADYLVKRFNSPSSRNFYCLAAWRIDGIKLNRLIDKAFASGRNPGGLFNYLVKEELKKSSLKAY